MDFVLFAVLLGDRVDYLKGIKSPCRFFLQPDGNTRILVDVIINDHITESELLVTHQMILDDLWEVGIPIESKWAVIGEYPKSQEQKQ